MIRNFQFSFGQKKKAKKNLEKGLAIGAVAGTAIGAAAGILFAPKSGKETRQEIKANVSDAADRAAEQVKNTAVKLGEEAVNLYKKAKGCCTDCIDENQPAEAQEPDTQETGSETKEVE